MGHFAGIVPCGISEYGVTSLVDLGLPVPWPISTARYKKNLCNHFPNLKRVVCYTGTNLGHARFPHGTDNLAMRNHVEPNSLLIAGFSALNTPVTNRPESFACH